jgi:hypothetical protein
VADAKSISPGQEKVPFEPKFIKTPLRNPSTFYAALYTQGVRGVLREPEYELGEAGRAEDTESYLMQSFIKKVGLFLKNGYFFKGNNPKTVEYIENRFKQMEIASDGESSIGNLVRSIASGIVRKSNAFLAKTRVTKASGGKVRRLPSGKQLEPVAAYFPIPPETIKYDLDEKGKRVTIWQHFLTENFKKDFSPEDIVHLHYNRKDGFIFGTPTWTPVLDDIRALRRIEENIELLIYQHLFPLFHYQVGNKDKPAGITERGESEVDIAERRISRMPSEGGIVTPENHEIKLLGAEGKALQAQPYLEHFKKRLFAGLSMSAIDFGEGDCYDSETETLTENGWKKHWEINHLNEKIATFNPETSKMEFNFANYKYEGFYSGDMICWKGKHIDVKVTPHHEMWVAPRNKNNLNWRKVQAWELFNEKFNEYYMMDSAPIDNKNEEDIFLPSYAKVTGRAKDISCKLVDFAELLGYYISEGCLDKSNGDRGVYRVVISQNKGEILDKICQCAERCGLSFSLIKCNGIGRQNQSGIKIYSKALYKFLEISCPGLAKEKFLPEIIWSWNFEQRLALFNALIMGDGTISKKKGATNKTYYTTSVSLANDVQVLALSLGLSAKVKETVQNEKSWGRIINRVFISGLVSKKYHARILNSSFVSKEHYEGTIYCYNVPNHLFVTRRNGKVTIQGNTSNRSTAQAMSQNLIDCVKDMQLAVEELFNSLIIRELLLEADFHDINIFDSDNIVSFKFFEIDIDTQIRQDNHYVDIFLKNAITWSELRAKLGYKPIRVPTGEEAASDEWLEDKYPEFYNTAWKLFDEPKALISATKRASSAFARAAADNRSLEVGEKDFEIEKQAEEEAAQEERTAKEKAVKLKIQSKPKGTSGKSIPAKDFKDSIGPIPGIMRNRFDAAEDMVVSAIQNGQTDTDWLKAKIRAILNPTKEELLTRCISEYINGFMNLDGRRSGDTSFAPEFSSIRKATIFRPNVEGVVDRLTEDLLHQLKVFITKGQSLSVSQGEIANVAKTVFDSLRYRANYIDTTELRSSFILGNLDGCYSLKPRREREEDPDNPNDPDPNPLKVRPSKIYVAIREQSHDSHCSICLEHNRKEIVFSSLPFPKHGDKSLPHYDLDECPPFHPNCNCVIKMVWPDSKLRQGESRGKEKFPKI